MKYNQLYTTKEIRTAVLEMINHFCPLTRGQKSFPTTIYRDRRKKDIRYKVDWKPEERYIRYLQAFLPGATIKAFDWKCWHPIGGSWIQPTIVITVPFYEEAPEEKDASAYERLKAEVRRQIEKHHIDWNTEEDIYDLILVLGDQSCISVDAADLTLYWSKDGVDWTDLYEQKDEFVEKVLKDVHKYGVVDYDFD